MGASLNSLRKYRLFLTLLVAPALAIAVVVVLIITLFGGDGETDTAEGTGTPAVTISPATGGTPSPVRTTTPIQVRPTQTPVVVDTPTVPAEPTATPEPTPTPEPTGPIVYTIQADETLSEIAERNGLTVDVLAAFNNLPDAEVIFAGQVIEIPTDQSQIDERLSALPVPVTAVVIPSDGLNVRDQPNTTTSAVQYVAFGGTQINLTGIVEDIDGIRWYELDDGNWVQGQYLELGVTAAAAPAAPASTSVNTAVVIPSDGLNVRDQPNTTTSTVQYVALGGSQLSLTGVVDEIGGMCSTSLSVGPSSV
jgi:LysM repeat protein